MRQTPLEDLWQTYACSSSHDNANRGVPCLRPSTRSDRPVVTYYFLANTQHSAIQRFISKDLKQPTQQKHKNLFEPNYYWDP